MGDEADIGDLPTGLAVSRGPTLVQRTSLAAKAGVAWAGVLIVGGQECPPSSRSVTNRAERAIKSTDGLGLKSGPIDFAVITPRIDLRPGNIGSPALAFGSASFGGHKRVLT